MADRVNKNYVTKGRAANPGQQARPFQCKWHEGCAKSFNRKSDLQRHYRIHTNERPYACDYKPCEKTFIQRSALTVHRRTHTGDKPHKCPYVGCGKCFSDSSSLARHRRIHTNDKPYICKNQHCRKAFCRKTTMTKHFRKEHPTDPIKEEEDAEFSDIDDSDEEADEEIDDFSPEDSYETIAPGREATHTPSQASTYSADLWPLPGQTKPRHLNGLHKRSASSTDLIKPEREFSRTPQRIFTDPYPSTHEQHPDFMLSRSNTMSSHVAPPSSVPSSMADMQHFVIEDNRMWHAQSALADSPTSLSSGSSGFPEPGFSTQAYQVQAMAMTPHQVSPYPQHQVAELQAVHDIVLDDPSPQQYTNMASAQQARYTSVPQQPHPQILAAQQQGFHISRPGTPQYPNDLPGTPGPNQPIQYMSADPLYGLDTFPPQQFVPSQANAFNFNSPFDMFKEFKTEDSFMQLPGQVMGGGMWGQ